MQPSSVHRKNNPHAAFIDPYQYPDKVLTCHNNNTIASENDEDMVGEPSELCQLRDNLGWRNPSLYDKYPFEFGPGA